MLNSSSISISDQRPAVVLFWYLQFNLYKFFKVLHFLLDFLFADFLWLLGVCKTTTYKYDKA